MARSNAIDPQCKPSSAVASAGPAQRQQISTASTGPLAKHMRPPPLLFPYTKYGKTLIYKHLKWKKLKIEKLFPMTLHYCSHSTIEPYTTHFLTKDHTLPEFNLYIDPKNIDYGGI